jgi:hypothetical protein
MGPNSMKNAFDVLVILARPAAGKSEIIDHLKHTQISERIQRFHIGDFDVIDDFPMLWTWFEEDAILTRLGHSRLHTDDNYYFIGDHLWDLLIERICTEYRKKLRDNPNYHNKKTALIEFSRGSEHGGFARAFQHLSPEMIEKMAILFINVSWEESLRKNQARFNPNRPDSILEHALPDEKLEKLYRYVDWKDVTNSDPAFIEIQGLLVPYVVFENEDDVTSKCGAGLTSRLENTLARLWSLYVSYNH